MSKVDDLVQELQDELKWKEKESVDEKSTVIAGRIQVDLGDLGSFLNVGSYKERDGSIHMGVFVSSHRKPDRPIKNNVIIPNVTSFSETEPVFKKLFPKLVALCSKFESDAIKMVANSVK